jgi:enoyl-CoA hydratase/carnithine racemase
MRIGRTSFYETLDLAAGDALARLHGLLGVVADGEEAAEGIAAFSEKRPPRWRRTTEG